MDKETAKDNEIGMIVLCVSKQTNKQDISARHWLLNQRRGSKLAKAQKM